MPAYMLAMIYIAVRNGIIATGNSRWFMTLSLATLALNAAGVFEVAGGDHCTASDPVHFYSFRAEGQTGRFATLVWLEPAPA